MDRVKATPKDFFLWAGAIVALYWSAVACINLLFNYINYAFPNPLNYYPVDPYQSGISFEMASIIVLFPTFLVLMHFIRRDIAKDPSRAQVWVRRWAVFLTLFVAGCTMAGDLIYVLSSFLNGSELTVPFLLKAAILFLIAAGGFMHFIADFWGYWITYPGRVRSVGWGVSGLLTLTILAGFVIVGTPMQARLYRFDAQKVSDLQTIQSQVVYYWQQKGMLPATLADLTDPLSGFTVPVDPQQGDIYSYQATNSNSFELCATFNAPTQAEAANYTAPVPSGAAGATSNNWTHGAGQVCFERTIDPKLYPPVNTK